MTKYEERINAVQTFEELREVANEIFGKVENNIKEASERINELNKTINERGSDSLEAIQETGKEQLELDQLNKFYRNQLEKRNGLLNDYSKVIYRKAENLYSQSIDKFDASKRREAEQKVLKHWKVISDTEKEYNQSKREKHQEVSEQLASFSKYVSEEQANRLYKMAPTNVSFSEMIKDGRLY